MHISFDRGQHNRPALRAFDALHLRLQISNCRLHDGRGIEHRRQLHFACSKQFADRFHAIQQHRIDEVQRRVDFQRRLQQIIQRLLVRTCTYAALAANNQLLQLVLDSKRLCGFFFRLGIWVFLQSGKVGHEDLQRVAFSRIAENELAGQLHFPFRNFVEWIDLRIIHNGHVQPAVHCLFQKHTVQHAPRVGRQSKGNIADAQDRFAFRQFLLEQLYGFQRFHPSRPIILLPS